MIRSVIPLASLGVAAALVSCPVPSLAGSPYYQNEPRQPALHDPDAGGVPNVPNQQGCVKLCENDLNPCDPPLYKMTDGRCNASD